jgi:hypothetical protein
MRKLFLTSILIFNFSHGMESQKPLQRAYNQEATEKLKNIQMSPIMEKLLSMLPENILNLFTSPIQGKIKELIEKGANPNIIMFHDTAGLELSALTVAICRTRPIDIDLIRVLLQYGANPDEFPPECSVNMLMCAAFYESPGAIEALLAHGANPNYKDKDGDTAIKYAKLASTKQALSKQKIA